MNVVDRCFWNVAKLHYLKTGVRSDNNACIHTEIVILRILRFSQWYSRGFQLVEALRYKPEGRGFDSRWYHWNFSLTQSFRPHYSPGVDSACNRNEYQEYFLGGKGRGELSYLAPLGSENISAPYFKQCFFRGRYYPPPDWVKHHASQSQERNNKYFILCIEFCINNKIYNVTFL